jgi:hypothetical protein
MLILLFAVLSGFIPESSSLELLRSNAPVVLNLKRPNFLNYSSWIGRVSVGRDHDDTVTSPRLFEKILGISPHE